MIGAHVRALAHGVIACAAVGAGCAKQVVRRPGGDWLRAIEIEGNRSIASDDLREGLALRRVQRMGGSPDPYLVVVDGERIEGEYLRRGFLEVDVRSRVERQGDATTVIYTVHEGRRARTRVVITGLPPDKPQLARRVRDALPLADGDRFSYAPYDEAKERLLLLVEDAGYAHARLDARVIADRVAHEAVIHLAYEVGPECTFGAVEIAGVDGELAQAVRGRLAFEEGEPYSASAIANTQRNIYAMRRFSTVRVLPDKTKASVIDVRVSLARGARNELGLGAGLGMDPTTYEVRGRSTYSIIGWPFPLTDTSVELRPAYAMLRDGSGYEPRIRAIAGLRRLDLFRPFVIGEVQGGYNYLAVEAYTSFGPRARLGLESPVYFDQLRLRAGWELEHLDFRSISPLIDPPLAMELGLDRSQRIGQYSQAVSLDLRDNPIQPRYGAYAEVRVDEGTRLAGGALEFVRVTPEVRGYVPLPRVPVVGAARVRVGRIWGDLPVTERYFSGGSTTQRGFAERRLAPSLVGPVDGEVRSVPIGGAELLEAGAELRARLGTVRGMDLGGVVFLDGADVVDRGQSLDASNLHWAAGAGVRLFTLVGAVRLDVGYRLNRTGGMEPEAGSRFAFHLSIGEAY